MPQFIVLLMICAGWCGCKIARGQNIADPQDTTYFKKRYYISHNDTLPYRIFVPRDYSPNTRYPLVVYLHGCGQRGKDNEAQLAYTECGPLTFANDIAQKKQPCIIIAPQCALDCYWSQFDWRIMPYHMPAQASHSMSMTRELVQSLRERFNLDQRRFIVTGISMGGMGAWDMAIRYAPAFQVVIPAMGGFDSSSAYPLINKFVWAFHAKDDSLVPYRATLEMVTRLRALRKALGRDTANIKFTTYETGGHAVCSQAYAEPALLSWLWDTAAPAFKAVSVRVPDPHAALSQRFRADDHTQGPAILFDVTGSRIRQTDAAASGTNAMAPGVYFTRMAGSGVRCDRIVIATTP
jgi:poly(3-hydroxybutyrate) depolymerase